METLYWVVALLTALLALYIAGTWPYDYFSKKGIPFLPPLPLLGNMGPMIVRSEQMALYAQRVYTHFQDYQLYGFYEFLKPVLVVRDPELIRLITVKDSDHFIDHRVAVSEDVEPLMARNLVGLQGQRWKDMRSTLSPAFTSSKMKNMFLLVTKCGDQMADYLEKSCQDSADGVVSLEMKEFFTRYTNDVIATSAFGIHVDSLAQPNNEFFEMGRAAAQVSTSRMLVMILFMLSPKFMKYLGFSLFPRSLSNFFRTLIHDTLEVRERKGIVRPDMIHLMMQARKGTLKHDDVMQGVEVKAGTKAELTEEDITANAMLFFLAGFDTASTLLSFMTHLLAVHPDVQRRVQQEMDTVLEADGGKVTYEGVQQMKYLDMVISETLRLYPPAAAIDRKCVKPYVLPTNDNPDGFKLNVDDGVWILIYAMHRDPKYFDHPDSFIPERFSDENKQKIHPFTYLPFGSGPRNCIGMRFALMETKIALVCMLRRFDIEVVSKTVVPLVLDKKVFSMSVEGGFWVGFKPRAGQ